MKSGVRKSGWPMPRLMISRPCAISALARASTAKAFSSPMRSKAAMVRSMRAALRLHAGGRHDRARQSHGVQAAPHEARSLRLLNERGRIGQRVGFVLRHRDRSGGIEEAAVEDARARDRFDDAAERFARERERIALAGLHTVDRVLLAGECEMRRIRRD